jgi:hypothetical protein
MAVTSSASGSTSATGSTIVSYIHLPAPGNKQAPSEFKGSHRKLERFLIRYEHVCAQSNVTDDKQKCLGIVQYCSPRVADLLENLDAYVDGDFGELEKEMQRLFDGSRKKAAFHRGYLEEFAKAWRRTKIKNLESFVKYNREYVRIAGPLKVAKQIDEKDFFKGFWEGLHRDTRDKLEKRMIDDEPGLDITTPFPVKKVIQAAEHVFNRQRFDKHLREGSSVSIRRKDKAKSKAKSKSKRRRSRKDSDSDESDDESDTDADTDSSTDSSDTDSDDDEPVSPWRLPKTSEKTKPKTSPKPEPESTVPKKVRDEISELTKEMERLHISQPRYRTLYVRLNLLSEKTGRLYPEPEMPRSRSYLNQEPRVTFNDQSRDVPPHQMMSYDQRIGDRRPEFICFGCGDRGHRMDQCVKLEAFITQGTVRRIMGRLRWADGSNIFREPDEPWISAITRRLQGEKVARDEGKGKQSVYLIEVKRDDSDADTDTQEELGWESGTAVIGNVQTFAADRTKGVSREIRKTTQKNVPQGAHRMEKFPASGQLNRLHQSRPTIPRDVNIDSHKNRLRATTTPTPIDVSPVVFEGKRDSELVPMEVEEVFLGDDIEDRRKFPTRESKGGVRNVVQGRPKQGKVQLDLTERILNSDLTLTVRELVSASRPVRQGLIGVLKAIRENGGDDKNLGNDENDEKEPSKGGPRKVMRTEETSELPVWMDPRKSRARLPKIEVTIGGVTTDAILDTGSMVNMASAAKAEETGLPIVPLDREAFGVAGIFGTEAKCTSWIPDATIFVTAGMKPTKGAIFILEDADFDMILGMPWLEDNKGAVIQRDRGTYISWVSGNSRYEINASKTRVMPVRVGDGKGPRPESDDSDSTDGRLTSYVAKLVKEPVTDQSVILVSDEEQEAPNYLQSQEVPDSDEDPMEAIEWARGQVAEWKRRRDDDDDDDADNADDEKDRKGKRPARRESTPPPNQLAKGKEKARRREEGKSQRPAKKRRIQQRDLIVVDRRVDEEFSRLEQAEADESEWETFCAKEGKRLARRNREWIRWIQDDDYEDDAPLVDDSSQPIKRTDSPSDPDGSEEDVPSPPRESSVTLETPPKESMKTVSSKAETSKSTPVSQEISVRRSRRVRRLTEKELYAQELKKRTYQRKEKASRTIKKRTRPVVREDKRSDVEDEPRIRGLCLQVVLSEPEEAEMEMGTARRRVQFSDHRTTTREPGTNRSRSDEPRAETSNGLDPEEQPRILEIPAGVNSSQRRPRGETRRVRNDPERPQHDLWEGSVGYAEPTRQPERELPVIPIFRGEPVSLEDSDESDGLSIIRPVIDMISTRNTGMEDVRSDEGHQRREKPRPESDVDPYRLGAWRKDYPSTRRSGSIDWTQPRPSVTPYETVNILVNRHHERTDSRPQQEPSHPTRDGPLQASQMRLPTDAVGGSGPNEPHEEDDDTWYTPNEEGRPWIRRVKRKNRRSNLHKDWEQGTTGVRGLASSINDSHESLRDQYESDIASEGTSVDLECKISQKARARDKRLVESADRRKDPETIEDSPEPAKKRGKTIKTKKPARRKPHLPPWLQKIVKPFKLSKSSKKSSLALCLLFLLILLVSYPFLRPTNTHPTMTNLSGVKALDERSSKGSRPTTRPSAMNDNPDASTTVAPTNDAPKAILSTISLPPREAMNHAILAIQHVVPLVIESSPDALEFLGRGTTVSIRYLNGKVVHHRGDVHIRVFAKGVDSSWEGPNTPSRTELDLLRGIMFREKGMTGVMDRIRSDARGILSFSRSLTPTEPRVRDYAEVVREKAREEVGVRVPPNTPTEEVKIGPPTLRRSGTSAINAKPAGTNLKGSGKRISTSRKSTPFQSQPVLESAVPDEDLVKVKEEEDEDWPFRMGILGRPSPPTSSTQDSNESSSTKVSSATSSPPKLTYSADARADPKQTIPKDVRPDEQHAMTLDNVVTSEGILEGGVRPAKEILTELVQVLAKLKGEFAASMDKEARQQISWLEANSAKFLEGADEDGDVDMEGNERTMEKEPVPAYRPTTPLEPGEIPYIPKPLAEIRFSILEKDIREVEKEVRESMWQATRDQVKWEDQLEIVEGRLGALEIHPRQGDDRFEALEARLAALEMNSGQQEEPWTVVRGSRRHPAREVHNRLVTRNMLRAVENKADGAIRDVSNVRKRVGDLEEALREADELRKKLAEIEGEMEGVKRETEEGGKKITALELQVGEARLRQELASRDNQQGKKNLVIAGLPPRVSKLESRSNEAFYRIVTLEEQARWANRIQGAMWLALSGNNPTEAAIQATTLQATWVAADEALKRRMECVPVTALNPASIPVPRMFPDSASYVANANTPPSKDNNPANTY